MNTPDDLQVFLYTALNGNRDFPRTDIPVHGKRRLFIEPVLNAKMHKILPHLFYPGYYSYMWVDANIFPIKNKEYYFTEYLDDYDMAIFKHPYRNTINEELEKLREESYYNKIPEVDLQVSTYHKTGFKDTFLYEANFIIRKNSLRVNNMFECWWSHICRWQYRDQISLPYVLSLFPDIKINTIIGNIRNHPDFIYKKHLS